MLWDIDIIGSIEQAYEEASEGERDVILRLLQAIAEADAKNEEAPHEADDS